MRTSAGSIHRPIVLIVLIIPMVLLGAIGTAIGLFMIVTGLQGPSGPMGHIGALFGLIVLVPSAVELVLAYGLWKLKPWGWWLSVIVHGLIAVLVAMNIVTPGSSPQYLLLGAALLAFMAGLFIPQVRQAFRSGR